MSYPEHLICINKHYYYRISIPVDLKHYFPVPIIQKTLKTTNIKVAKPLLIATEYKVQRTFALLRSGMLPDDTARLVVEGIIPTKQKAAVVSPVGYTPAWATAGYQRNGFYEQEFL